MIRCALQNVDKIYDVNYSSPDDLTDLNEFFCEFFTGTHISRDRVEDLRKLLG